jgi:hypothetical protein
MIYDYGPANFGDTNGNYVSCSLAAQQQTDKLEFDRLSKLFTDSRYRLAPSSVFGSLV